MVENISLCEKLLGFERGEIDVFYYFSVINHYKLYVKIKGRKIKYKVRLTYSENMGNPYFRFNNTDQLKNCLHLGLFMHVYIMMSYYGKYLILDIFWGGALTVHRDSLVQFTDTLPPCKIIHSFTQYWG